MLPDEIPEFTVDRHLPSRSMRNHNMNEADHLLPTVPIREAQKSVHAKKEAKGSIFVLGPEFGQRIDRIRRPPSSELSRVYRESGFAFDGRPHHAESRLARRREPVAERLEATGYEPDFLQRQTLQQLQSGS